MRVCQRVKENEADHSGDPDEIGDTDARDNNAEDAAFEVWALIEYETVHESDVPANPLGGAPAPRRHKQWRRFASEAALSDHIRRDTGEPLALPACRYGHLRCKDDPLSWRRALLRSRRCRCPLRLQT